VRWKLLDFFRQEVQALASAVAFFSRFPLRPRPFDLERGVFYLPLLALVFGALLYGVGTLLEDLLDPLLLGALLLSVQYWGTNYFHFDGLIDTADALAAHVSISERLRLLKTPEVGVLGFLFGFFFLLTEFLMVATFVREALWWAIFLRPLVGRLVMLLVGFLGEPAKREGLGLLFLKSRRWRLLMTQLFWVPVFYLYPLPALGLICLGPLMLECWRHNFGGLTGDLLGATEELAEWIFSLALTIGLGLGSW